MTADDIKELEKILWNDLGTKENYETEYGKKPLGEFVREIVGLDMNAAKAAFSKYLNDVNLDSRQIYFVNQFVEYIVQNGMMKDLSVLQEPPFTDRGSIVTRKEDRVMHGLGLKSICSIVDAVPGALVRIEPSPEEKIFRVTLLFPRPQAEKKDPDQPDDSAEAQQ